MRADTAYESEIERENTSFEIEPYDGVVLSLRKTYYLFSLTLSHSSSLLLFWRVHPGTCCILCRIPPNRILYLLLSCSLSHGDSHTRRIVYQDIYRYVIFIILTIGVTSVLHFYCFSHYLTSKIASVRILLFIYSSVVFYRMPNVFVWWYNRVVYFCSYDKVRIMGVPYKMLRWWTIFASKSYSLIRTMRGGAGLGETSMEKLWGISRYLL